MRIFIRRELFCFVYHFLSTFGSLVISLLPSLFHKPHLISFIPSQDWLSHLLIIKSLAYTPMQTIALSGPDVQIIKTYSLKGETSQVPI